MLQYQTKEAITHSLINGNRLYTDSDSFSIIPWGEVERYIRDFQYAPSQSVLKYEKNMSFDTGVSNVDQGS